MAEDQGSAIAFLSNPSSYGPGVDNVQRYETHISIVFLAGDRAYKLKRAVRYPYLDFSTVEQRRRACEAELLLNRRTAPELYLEVRPIVGRLGGGAGWDGDGPAVDWVVVMRRFRQDQLLEAIARAGRLEPPLLYALAAHIADFHRRAESRPSHGGAEAMRAIVAENDACLRACRTAGFSQRQIGELGERSKEWLNRVGGLLDRRRQEGKVRLCHGDLHLRNICVLDHAPVLFDCIEFSEDFASIDVLYDLAFLLMDLEHLGDAASANRLLNRYLDLTGEDDGLAAMPLFLSLRAVIRAHVTASAGGADRVVSAQHYLDQACRALSSSPARLVAIGGLSGTGKSTVAAALASQLGARPGARVLRSDVIRKRLFGLAPESRLPQSAYGQDVTERVYAALRDGAAVALRAGYCAIIDAVALNEEERQSFAEIARHAGVPFTGLWFEAPPETLLARVDRRKRDASDATREIVRQQLLIDPGRLDWRRVDAGKGKAETLAAARKALALV